MGWWEGWARGGWAVVGEGGGAGLIGVGRVAWALTWRGAVVLGGWLAGRVWGWWGLWEDAGRGMVVGGAGGRVCVW